MGHFYPWRLAPGTLGALAILASCSAPNDTRILVEDLTSPTPAFDRDEDQDGVTVLEGDCDDRNPSIYPPDPGEPGSAGAPEGGSTPEGLVGDGLDNDCDGIIDDGTLQYDDDRDGISELEGDCDDENPGIVPDRTDGCDGLDNDCDGQIDEDAVDLNESNDTPASAVNVGNVSCGYVTRALSIFPDGDVDYFQMTVLDVGSACTFAVTAYLLFYPPELEFNLTLYKLSNGQLTYLDSAQSSEDYFVQFRGSGGVDDTGQYVVEVSEAPGRDAVTCQDEVSVYLEGF